MAWSSEIFTMSHFQALIKAAGGKPNLESALYFVPHQVTKHILYRVVHRAIWSDQCELVTEGWGWEQTEQSSYKNRMKKTLSQQF